MSRVKFKVILSVYNCFEWLPHCLSTISAQSYRNFDVTLVDNASTQAGQWEWTDHFCRSRGWVAVRNEQNSGPLGGLVEATRRAAPEDDDVIIHIDGDDWLAHGQVFARIASIYEKGGVDLTYGQFSCYPTGKLGDTAPYPRRVIRERSYRSHRMSFGHLRTFKAFLWKAIRDEDLRAPTGEYIRYCPDFAFMAPLMEMVGERFEAVSEVLYIYNRSNASAETAEYGASHLSMAAHLRLMAPYPVHERCR